METFSVHDSVVLFYLILLFLRCLLMCLHRLLGNLASNSHRWHLNPSTFLCCLVLWILSLTILGVTPIAYNLVNFVLILFYWWFLWFFPIVLFNLILLFLCCLLMCLSMLLGYLVSNSHCWHWTSSTYLCFFVLWILKMTTDLYLVSPFSHLKL